MVEMKWKWKWKYKRGTTRQDKYRTQAEQATQSRAAEFSTPRTRRAEVRTRKLKVKRRRRSVQLSSWPTKCTRACSDSEGGWHDDLIVVACGGGAEVGTARTGGLQGYLPGLAFVTPRSCCSPAIT